MPSSEERRYLTYTGDVGSQEVGLVDEDLEAHSLDVDDDAVDHGGEAVGTAAAQGPGLAAAVAVAVTVVPDGGACLGCVAEGEALLGVEGDVAVDGADARERREDDVADVWVGAEDEAEMILGRVGEGQFESRTEFGLGW
ncbi:hypothetical protein ColTof4_00150 [Colletotrichum tofieldiae]|nr:hypothetical protein ColTof3_07349 [Colletotrichum tofieldiae]GKT67728.1 hypothetical protein ColTof4_00150 [Colletotrichum tofieldiae]GKT91315.1 hypothetical protein Ct61P_09165 [Colletotrichum tofieldiae]